MFFEKKNINEEYSLGGDYGWSNLKILQVRLAGEYDVSLMYTCMTVHNSEEIPSKSVSLLLDIFYYFMGAMQIARKYFGIMVIYQISLMRYLVTCVGHTPLIEVGLSTGWVESGLEFTSTRPDWFKWLKIGPILDRTYELDPVFQVFSWVSRNRQFGGSWLQIRQKNESNKLSIKWIKQMNNKIQIG